MFMDSNSFNTLLPRTLLNMLKQMELKTLYYQMISCISHRKTTPDQCQLNSLVTVTEAFQSVGLGVE